MRVWEWPGPSLSSMRWSLYVYFAGVRGSENMGGLINESRKRATGADVDLAVILLLAA